MQTTTTITERFEDVFGTTDTEGYVERHGFDNPETVLGVSADETTVLLDPERRTFGAVHLPEYNEENSWTMGYAEWNDSTHAVYLFNREEWNEPIIIDADLIEDVAEVLDTTPAEVADRAQTYRYYPIAIPSDYGTFAIAPVASETYRTEE